MPATKRKVDLADDATEDTVTRLSEEVLINATDDENEDIEVDPNEEKEPEEPEEPEEPSRDQKKQSRWKEHKDAREAAERKAADLEKELAETRGRIGALEQTVRQPAPPQQQVPGPDRFDEAEKRLMQEIEDLQETYRKLDPKQTDQEDLARHRRKYMELDGHLQNVRIQRGISQSQQSQQQQQPNPQAQAAVMHVRMNYPDLADSEPAMMHVQGLVAQKQAQRNRISGRNEPPTMQMLDEALKDTRKAFGLAPARPTTPARAAAYSGVASGPTQANGSKKVTIPFVGDEGKPYRKMAAARWPKLYAQDPKKAHAKLAAELAEDDDA
jgi:hypothetical protein